MQYSLGTHNQLNSYIRQSTGRKQSLYSVKSTEDLQRHFVKLKEENECKINQLEQRLQLCLNLDQRIERSVDSRDSRARKQGLCINLQRYEDLLQCNFKEIQWARSSRMSEDGQAGEKLKKVETIQEQVNKLQSLILQRESEQQKSLGQLQLRIVEELKHIRQNFEEASLKQQKTHQLQFGQLFALEKQFSENMLDLEEGLKIWEISASKLLQVKIQQIESQLLTLNPKK